MDHACCKGSLSINGNNWNILDRQRVSVAFLSMWRIGLWTSDVIPAEHVLWPCAMEEIRSGKVWNSRELFNHAVLLPGALLVALLLRLIPVATFLDAISVFAASLRSNLRDRFLEQFWVFLFNNFPPRILHDVGVVLATIGERSFLEVMASVGI